MIEPWPMVTSSPICVASPPELTCTMVPSCRLVRAPMRMMFMSPRTRQLNQTPLSAPITTSPITAALGAMKASGAMVGTTPSRA